MEINSASQPPINLSSNLRQGDAFLNGTVTGNGSQGNATLNSTLGSQTDNQSATIGDPQLTLDPQQATQGIAEQSEQLSEAAETAFGSLFFSMLQNILSEAQNNSSA